jgi:hypothetical protein
MDTKDKKICPYCKGEIDKNAVLCVKCGRRLKKKITKGWLAVLIIPFLPIIWIMMLGIMLPATEGNSQQSEVGYNTEVANSELSEVSEEVESETVKDLSEEEYKALCKEYSYKDVLRNPENYVGEKVVITVEISSVYETSWLNPVKYYFAYAETEPGNGFFWGDRYCIFDKRENTDLKILKTDIIKVWGEISEPRETESLIVNSEELFCIDMKYVELVSE